MRKLANGIVNLGEKAAKVLAAILVIYLAIWFFSGDGAEQKIDTGLQYTSGTHENSEEFYQMNADEKANTILESITGNEGAEYYETGK